MILIGCGNLAYRMAGMRDPQEPVPQSKLMEFANKTGIDTNRVLFWTSSEAKTSFLQKHGYLPDLYVFDKWGNWLPYRENASCNAAGFNLAAEFCHFKFSSPDTTDPVGYYLSHLRRSDSTVVGLTGASDRDYTILISWARFAGKTVREHLPRWQEELDKNKECSFQVYYVCFDRVKRQQ